jgi:hypothetical protein
MKKLLLLCIVLLSSAAWSQKLPKIKGSGIVELQEVALQEHFDAIKIDGDIDVELVQGDHSGYSVETDDNLIETVAFSVKDSVLYVTLKQRITRKKKLVILVETPIIQYIELQNEAGVESKRALYGEYLTIIGGKSTTFDLNTEYTGNVAIELYSDAKGKLSSKTAKNTIKLDDRATLELYSVTDSLSAKTIDNAKLTLDGTIRATQLTGRGSSKIDGRKVSLETLDLNLSDKADAALNIKEVITLYLQDTAVLELYGDPEITVSGLKNKAKILKKE